MSTPYSENLATSDSIHYRKHCKDFKCLSDGTLTGEYKYCNLSNECRQIDMIDNKPIPMESHYCPVVNPFTEEIVEWGYYCTGMHDVRPLSERVDDDKVA